MEPIKVFISSVLNRSREDLSAEREAAKRAVSSLGRLASVWAFEDQPASPKSLRDSYIDEVKASDVFVLLMGKVLTGPTREEYETARDYGRPILVFVKDLPKRENEATELLQTLDRKYATFASPAQLEEAVHHALGQQLLSWAKSGVSGGTLIGDGVAVLRAAKQKGSLIRMSPLVPIHASDLFRIYGIESGSIIFQKTSSSALVTVPSSRIVEVLPFGDHEPVQVALNGRVQWHTLSEEWRFRLESPDQTDGLMLGLGRQSGLQDPLVIELSAQLAQSGRQASWSRLDRLPARLDTGYEVFYGEDGRYIYSPGRDGQVLVVKPNQAATSGPARPLSVGKVHLVR